MENIAIAGDIENQKKEQTVEEKMKEYEEEYDNMFGKGQAEKVHGEAFFWKKELKRTLKEHERELNSLKSNMAKELDDLMAPMAVWQARSAVEFKENLILKQQCNLPPFFEEICSVWLGMSTNELNLEEESCASNASLKLAKMIGKKFEKQLKSVQPREQQSPNKWQMTKHYKIWLYGFIYCEHTDISNLRRHLGEPADADNDELMKAYYNNVVSFCTDITALYQDASEKIHASVNVVPKTKLLSLLESQIHVSESMKKALKVIMNLE